MSFFYSEMYTRNVSRQLFESKTLLENVVTHQWMRNIHPYKYIRQPERSLIGAFCSLEFRNLILSLHFKLRKMVVDSYTANQTRPEDRAASTDWRNEITKQRFNSGSRRDNIVCLNFTMQKTDCLIRRTFCMSFNSCYDILHDQNKVLTY